MKRIRRIACAIIAGICCTTVSFAHKAEDLVDAQTLSVLRQDGMVSKKYYKAGKVNLRYVPKTALSKKAGSFWTSSEDPAFIVENLYLMPKDKLGDSSRTNIDYASKVIRSVSKMEGMEYYSHSDRKMKVLYKSAYCIKGPDDRTKVPDNTAGSADGKVLYCMQDDASFGKTNYRLEYFQNESEVSAGFTNCTPVYLGPIKAIENGKLKISMVIIDCGNEMMVYLLTQAKFPALKVLEDTMNDSFSSRLDAVYNWFIRQF